MITIEFGAAEHQTLERNSLFIKMYGGDFKDSLQKIKSLWNRTYLKQTCEWEIPYSCLGEVQQLFQGTEIRYLNEPPKAKLVTDDDILHGLDFNGFNLYDYQLEGVKYGLNHQNWLLLDEQGLGKTLQAISLARYKKQHNNLKHCLIVCGINSLKWNWQREISKFCKDEEGIVLGTRKNSKGKIVSITVNETKEQIKQCPEQFFWIINIEKMRASNSDLKKKDTIIDVLNEQIEQGNLGMLIVDEVHKIKNLLSSQANGLMHIDKRVSKMLMTGTLLVNNPIDLYCPMSICGLINYNKWVFDKKFVIKDDYNQIIGYQNMDELHNILYKSSLRRTKDLLDLPDKIYKQEWLEFSSEEQNVFNQVIGTAPFNLEKIDEPTEVMACITRMRQATVCGELLTEKCKTSTKFDRLNDILEEARINGQKVLVFCPFTQALELGMNYCKQYNPKLIKGGMGNKIQEVVDEHENTPGFSVIFAQEATLGVGFTLTNTEICVFLSPPWNRATYDQCSDRIHRIGQKHTVQIIDLLIKDTYDECIYKKLHGKGAMSDVIIDGQEIDSVKEYLSDIGVDFRKYEYKQQQTLLDGISVI